MPSLTTVYRAIVMIATGVLMVKGWQTYGPTQDQLRKFVGAALEKAQSAWNGSQDNAAVSPAAVDPRSTPPPLVASPPMVAEPTIEPAPQLVPLVGAGNDSQPSAGDNSKTAATQSGSDQDVRILLARLHELGAADAQVGPWGSSGEFYRCCCRARFADKSPLARHFEAVAEEPSAAVEQVVAKVEGWRNEQQNLGR
jgi:hypothetical protein